MGRPRLDPKKAPTRARLISAAGEVFARDGFAGAKLSAIASAVGIRRPSLLYHFATKEELYAAVIHDCFADLDQALQAAFVLEGPFEARLDAVARGYLRFLEGHPTFSPLLLRELLDGQGPGQRLVLEGLVPLLGAVEGFLERSAEPPPGVSVRTAILTIAAEGLLRSVAGDLREPLWGPGRPETPAIAAALLLRAIPPPESDRSP